MQDLLMNYLPILVFLGVAAGLGLVLILAAIIVAVRNPDAEKTSAYECGFNAFDDARMKFDVRFYLVSILFMMVIAPAIAAAVVLTRVPFIRMRAEVLPAPPMMGATFTPIFAMSVVLAIAATPIASRNERRMVPRTASGMSLIVRLAAKSAKLASI